MRFDLTDLRLFRHVVEAGSITGGAARSHLALAAASARIRGMETALGVALLTRGRRGVRPTPAGSALLDHARLVAEQLDRMRDELALYAQGLKGHVRLLSNTAGLTERLPEVLSAFLADHPGIDVDLEEKPSADIIRAVVGGLADIGIVADTVDPTPLETFPFHEDRLVVVTGRDHALARRRQVGFAEFLDHDLVGLAAGSALQDYLGEQAARLGRRLAFRVRLRSVEAVCRMVERGVGIAILPLAAARRAQRSRAIRRLRLAERWAERHLTIAVRRFAELPAPAQELVRRLRG